MNFCYVTSFKEGGVALQAILHINVTYFYEQSPDPRADNDWDYYGYTDVEWEVEKIDVFSEETEELVYTIDNPEPEYIEMNYDVTLDGIEEWLIEQMEEIGENK